MAANVSRSMYRGDTLKILLSVTRDGAKLDVTGAGFFFTAKSLLSMADSAAEIRISPTHTTQGSATITSATDGQVTVTLLPVATDSTADAGVTLLYDIQMVESGGAVTTLESGSLAIAADVTREIA